MTISGDYQLNSPPAVLVLLKAPCHSRNSWDASKSVKTLEFDRESLAVDKARNRIYASLNVQAAIGVIDCSTLEMASTLLSGQTLSGFNVS